MCFDKGQQEFVVYTEDIAETIAAFSLNHHPYVDDMQLQKNIRTVDTGHTHNLCESGVMCCSNQSLVLLKTAAAQC